MLRRRPLIHKWLIYVFYQASCEGMPVPMVALSKAWVCGRSPAETVGSIPAGVMDVCILLSVVCCQVEVSATVLITRPEQSYRIWCVVVYDLETS
jgi:hypothetical protein